MKEVNVRGFLAQLAEEDLGRGVEFSVDPSKKYSVLLGELMQHAAIHAVHRGQMGGLRLILLCLASERVRLWRGNNDEKTSYNALQTTFKQRLSRGLNFDLDYTWSKSIDDASNGIYSGTRGVSFPQDSFNLRAERAVSSFDTRHRFSANFTYDLDFLPSVLSHWPRRVTEGWRLGGIYTGSSGLPITPFLSADVSGTGELNDRPNLVADPSSLANLRFDHLPFIATQRL